ncbi:hypothetical protein BDV39DRAFT_200226 [Aspergillus sergii]|uniref:Uncharacterized protein n=1 Tax=Aspergillus sergii TaxID=1034303 RepID=A0A5N6XIM8_9EURO|nr:hypothetical protein BDV39DRAFT_200226 [Aspergillus sergii]
MRFSAVIVALGLASFSAAAPVGSAGAPEAGAVGLTPEDKGLGAVLGTVGEITGGIVGTTEGDRLSGDKPLLPREGGDSAAGTDSPAGGRLGSLKDGFRSLLGLLDPLSYGRNSG